MWLYSSQALFPDYRPSETWPHCASIIMVSTSARMYRIVTSCKLTPTTHHIAHIVLYHIKYIGPFDDEEDRSAAQESPDEHSADHDIVNFK